MSEPEKLDASSRSVAAGLKPHLLYKCLLNQYAQKLRTSLPAYQTHNEGFAHQPKFRSTVWIDGMSYTSPNTFQHRKLAEMDVSRIAFFDIMQKLKNEASHLVREDKGFCKSILFEYAARMNIEKPTYQTVQLEAAVPVFCSTLVFNGISYTGDSARNKKDAEQLVARSVILSYIDSETGHVMSEIINCKFRHFSEMNKVKGVCNVHSGNNAESNIALDEAKGEVKTSNMPHTSAMSEPSLVQVAAKSPPLAVSQQPIPEVSSQSTNPVLPVPPALAQTPPDLAVTQQPIPEVSSQATTRLPPVPLALAQTPSGLAVTQQPIPEVSSQATTRLAVTQQPILEVSSQATSRLLPVRPVLAHTPFTGTSSLPTSCAISSPCLEQFSDVPASHLSPNVIQPPNPEALSGTVAPPVLEQMPGVSSPSSRKRNRKNKKNVQKRMRVDAQLPISANEVPPCSVAH